jgi:hypothetical protein
MGNAVLLKTIRGSLLAGVIAGFSVPASAASILTNGDFEGGFYTSGLNLHTPNGWTANAAFQNDPSYSGVDGNTPHTGGYDLHLANYSSEPVDMVSQTLATTIGATYNVSFYLQSNSSLVIDPLARFQVLINDVAAFTQPGASFTWALETFTFVGTGSDVFTLAGRTDRDTWAVDDISVERAAAIGSTPLPAALPLFATGLAGLGWLARRRRKQAA